MRTRTNPKFITATVVFLIAFSFSFGQEKEATKTLQKSLKRNLRIEDVKAYRQLHRVNRKPVVMDEATSKLCAAFLREPIAEASPHSVAGVVYYINDIAQQGLSTFKEKREFPLGSIIVKEKQEDQTEGSVKIITVMKKIKAGKKEDSWDYRLYDVTAWQELKQLSFADRTKATPTHAVKCIDCHRKYRENDFVSPTGMYLFFPKQ